MMRTSLPGLLLVLVLTVPAVGSAGTLPRTEPEAETGADPALSAGRAFLAAAGALPGSDARAAPLLDAALAALELAEGSDTRPAAWPEVLRAALRLRAGWARADPMVRPSRPASR